MSNWYHSVVADLNNLPRVLQHYESELVTAKAEVKVSGRLERNSSELPGIVEQRFNQLQEIEAILNYMNLELRKLRRKHFQQYMEGYDRVLTARDADKYVDGEVEVVDYEILINEVALMRNKWLGVIKGIEMKHWQLSNVIKLRTAGLDDASV
jgi:hypothetical protein